MEKKLFDVGIEVKKDISLEVASKNKPGTIIDLGGNYN